MGVYLRAVLSAVGCCLCFAAAGCAKPRAQAAAPPPPEPLPLHDHLTGRPCGKPSEKPGMGITPPKPIFRLNRNPEYTEAARRAKVNGTVYMVIDVGSDGLVKNVCLKQSLTKDLDEQAMKAVRTWRFEPARKEGVPMPYTMTADVSFNLY